MPLCYFSTTCKGGNRNVGSERYLGQAVGWDIKGTSLDWKEDEK